MENFISKSLTNRGISFFTRQKNTLRKMGHIYNIWGAYAKKRETPAKPCLILNNPKHNIIVVRSINALTNYRFYFFLWIGVLTIYCQNYNLLAKNKNGIIDLENQFLKTMFLFSYLRALLAELDLEAKSAN